MYDHTFVIPAYKESPYLENCIKSLLGQTVKSTIILTTSTPSVFLEGIAKKYGLGYFINPNESSIAGDWNFALSKVNTKLATLAHQDDIYAPEYAEKVIDGVRDNQDVLIAFTNYADLVGEKVRSSSLNSFVKSALLWPFFFSKRLKSRYARKIVLLFGDPIACPAVTFNLAALKSDFAFSNEYSCALDWYAWLELSKRKGSFLYINQKLLLHRIHPDSETTNQLSRGIRQKEELQIFELMWGKNIAKMLSRMYAAGYKDNQI
ncbi:MAG: glycosyltransferase [Sphingobacteriales bacterium]|nr:MAG: glycosyltransferase [Sphingobacteriales bacterium]